MSADVAAEAVHHATSIADALDQLAHRQVWEIQQEPTGFPNRTDSVLSWVGGTRTFTITPAVTSFDYYISGVQYTKSAAESIILADTSGQHVI